MYSALFGISLGVLFDIIRIFRRSFSGKSIATALADLIFWCIAIISLLAFVLTVCDGKMRWYVLFGIGCGCFIYMAALSEIVYNVISCTAHLIRKLLYYATRPLYFLLRFIWRVFRKSGVKAEQGIKNKIKVKRQEKKERAGGNGDKKKKKAKKSVS